jgi:hypothetical protein
VTTRTARGRIIFRRMMPVVAYAMVLISFALGYVLHPM